MGAKTQNQTSLDGKKILIIVPAYNEAQNIGQTLTDIKTSAGFADVIVINDGSLDTTAKIVTQSQTNLIDLPFNLGIGGAMQAGYKYAASQGYDIAIQVDGDGQHDASSVRELIEPLLTVEVDMVIGSRHIEDRGYNVPLARRTGMMLFARMLSLIIGQLVTDTTSGFRAVNRRTIQFFAENYPTDYPEVESLVICHFAGLKLIEVPVFMRHRQGGRSSITAIHAPYYMIKVSLAVLIWLIRRKPILKGGE